MDRFACSYNAKLSRFNSRFYQPGAEAVDAFAQNWEGENNWVHPPVSQISRVITHMRACKAVGTLVIPLWKSSYFWILLCDNGKHWNAFVHDWVILPKFGHLFIRGKAKNHVFGSKDLSFSVVARRLNFVQPRVQSVLCFCTVEDDNTPIEEKPEVAWKRGLRALRPWRRLAVKTNGCRKKFQDGASKY